MLALAGAAVANIGDTRLRGYGSHMVDATRYVDIKPSEFDYTARAHSGYYDPASNRQTPSDLGYRFESHPFGRDAYENYQMGRQPVGVRTFESNTDQHTSVEHSVGASAEASVGFGANYRYEDRPFSSGRRTGLHKRYDMSKIHAKPILSRRVSAKWHPLDFVSPDASCVEKFFAIISHKLRSISNTFRLFCVRAIISAMVTVALFCVALHYQSFFGIAVALLAAYITLQCIIAAVKMRDWAY